MNRAEPLVARDDATTALVFDVFKECTHDGGRYVEHDKWSIATEALRLTNGSRSVSVSR